MTSEPIRILFVFASLGMGGEEIEVRLLARNLDPSRYRVHLVACFREPSMPSQTHAHLRALGIDVDTTPYELTFAETVTYLARKVASYDLVVSCQNVADIYPALERTHLRPPLIERGSLVADALAGPKHLTNRYVGLCGSVRDAAAGHMPGREHYAVAIPFMVDLSQYRAGDHAATRAALGLPESVPVIGFMGQPDAGMGAEDFIEAAAIVHQQRPDVQFLVLGGADAAMPDHAEKLHLLALARHLHGKLRFIGNGKDSPRLLAAMDILASLSRGHGMAYAIAEAGAARLPVIATTGTGSMPQIEDGVSGLVVPDAAPEAIASAMLRLLDDRALRAQLGTALHERVSTTQSVTIVVPQWQALFDAVLAERVSAPPPQLFQSYFQGGFECSSHRLRTGTRLDVLASTGHDQRAETDYQQLQGFGIATVRDGLRWHRIEPTHGAFDWSSVRPMLEAARSSATQVIWDLLHYGWPDDVDIWQPGFADRFARFAGKAAQVVKDHSDAVPFYCPINEISFTAWGGGDVQYLNPFGRNRGLELKVQLVRAAIAAMHAVLDVDPRARFVHADPVINVVAAPERPQDLDLAEGHRQTQYQAWDMLSGLAWPQLGGAPHLLDIVGVNYYSNNQWIHEGLTLDVGHAHYQPLHRLLMDIHGRYGRPILVAETGIESDRRAGWLAYVAAEAEVARRKGVPMEGVCLYPVLNHLGWDDDRMCENGLLELTTEAGQRGVYHPLAQQLSRLQTRYKLAHAIV